MTPIRNSRLLLAAALAFALLALACFAIPIYVIRPFRHQGSTELPIALFVKQVGPWVSGICVALCLVIAVYIWPRARAIGTRALAVLFLLIAAGGAYLARLNIYELMFHAAGAPQFEAANRVKIDADDMVIAVRLHGLSRAYPIREMAYHHIVNDTISGEPIVSTY